MPAAAGPDAILQKSLNLHLLCVECQALEGGSSDSEDSDPDRPQTYTQEQQDVKNAFLEVHMHGCTTVSESACVLAPEDLLAARMVLTGPVWPAGCRRSGGGRGGRRVRASAEAAPSWGRR
jgi:hypothetical protein